MVAPMRLTDTLHLVGSGWLGSSLSDAHDSHVYLLRDGERGVLLDAGCGLGAEQIVANIAATGLDPARVEHVLLTHAHADHAAGAAALHRLLGARIWASAEVADIVSSGDEDRSGLAVARSAGVYPSGLRFPPVPVESWPPGGLAVGGLAIEALPTPGHAAGHLCYRIATAGRTLLFTGDLVFSRGRIALLGTPDTDLAALRDSIAAVLAAGADALLPGHGSVVLNDAAAHLRAALDRFALGQLPPGLLP